MRLLLFHVSCGGLTSSTLDSVSSLSLPFFCIEILKAAINAKVPYLQPFLNTGSQTVAITLTAELLIIIFCGNRWQLHPARCLLSAGQRLSIQFLAQSDGTKARRTIQRFLCDIILVLRAVSHEVGKYFRVQHHHLHFHVGTHVYLPALDWLSFAQTNLRSTPTTIAMESRTIRLAHQHFCVLLRRFRDCYELLPGRLPVDTSCANWAPAVWAGVILISVVTYFVHGRKHFTPPVMFVEGKRTGGLQESG